MAAIDGLQSKYPDLLGVAALPVLEAIFQGTVKQFPSVAEKCLKRINHDREIYQFSELHDLALFSSVAEGADYTFDSPEQGSDKTLTAVKFGLGLSLSEELFEDSKLDFVADGVRKLAMSAAETREQAAMDLFNNGMPGGSETTADGLTIFNTSHTTPGGVITIANKPAVDVDLSFSSLADSISAYKKAFRGDSGIYQSYRPTKLLVPTELELYANQIVKSALETDTNNNNMNPFRQQLEVVASPHLTDADAFFLLSDPDMHFGRIVTRKGLETKAAVGDAGFVNDNLLYKARYRESYGVFAPHGMYGTSGA